MAENGDLEALIAKDPDDVDGYLVYGDWLEAQGDPRGALIALQADQRGGKELEKAIAAHLEKHRRALFGELAEYKPYEVEIDWRLGFFDRVRLRLVDPYTVRMLKAVLDEPSSRFLRRLELEPGATATMDECVSLLLAKGPPTLRYLKMDAWQLADDPRAEELKARFPRLELPLEGLWKDILTELKSTRKAKTQYRPEELPPLTMRPGVNLAEPVDAATVLSAIRLELGEERPVRAISAIRQTFTDESLDEFMVAVGKQYDHIREPAKYRWGFFAMGPLGGDRCAAWLGDQIAHWTPQRAQQGCDSLGRIGSGLALYELYGFASDAGLRSTHRRAAEEALARVVEEHHVGLNELLDRAVPPSAPSEAFARIRVTTTRRLEQRMVSGRRLAPHELRRYFAEHPLIGELAERVVWATYDGQNVVATFRVVRGEAGVRAQALDASGQAVLIEAGASIGVLHPAELAESARKKTLAAWKSAFESAKTQPLFEQIDRPVFELKEPEGGTNLGRFKMRRVDYRRLRDVLVTARGWHPRGATMRWEREDDDGEGHGPTQWERGFERDGVHVFATLDETRRSMTSVRALRQDAEVRFDELHAVTVSEVLYDLETAILATEERAKPSREEVAALEEKAGVHKGQRVRLGLRANEGKGKWGVIFWIGEKNGIARCGLRTDDGETIWADVNTLEKSSAEEIEASLKAKEKAEKKAAVAAPPAPGSTPKVELSKGDRVRWRNGSVTGTGKVFWLGPGKFGGGPRAGVKDDDTGETIWTEQSSCERLP